MSNVIRKISLDNLVPHPDNPNRMSKQNFDKLVRNIQRTGRYEPLIVRPCPVNASSCSESPCASVFQIINGHHRWLALRQLGCKTADCLIWDTDDQQTDILLSTLNRLCGTDMLEKKLALLKRLMARCDIKELSKLLPQTKKQIERLTQLDSLRVSSIEHQASSFANPLVFFVSDKQMQIIETALNYALQEDAQRKTHHARRATRRAEAIGIICQHYLDHRNDGRETIDEGQKNAKLKRQSEKLKCI